MAPTNVILLGESGSGKSSIVNMLSGNEYAADTSSDARGRTVESKAFEVDILGQSVTLWDTVGLGEGSAVARYLVARPIAKLIYNIGASLLVFVLRAPRIKSSAALNWKLYHQVICKCSVPTVIVITGLEQEENMDKWWWDNKGTLEGYGITPAGFACITASRGKPQRRGDGHVFDDEFEESREKVRSLIRSTALASPWHLS